MDRTTFFPNPLNPMYEIEANARTESAEQLPADVISALGDFKHSVSRRTLLPWSEHCTECAWPMCYSTCDLYSPRREDGRCRRFVDGMVRIDVPEAANGYILKIRFKRWAKLWTPGNIRLHQLDHALKIERRDRQAGTLLYQIRVPAPLKAALINKRYNFKKRIAARPAGDNAKPSAFVLECYNPGRVELTLTLTIRSAEERNHVPFQALLHVNPGLQKIRVPVSEIAPLIDLHGRFNVEIVPNQIGEEVTLYFGLMEFVEEIAGAAALARVNQGAVKCVVWDLDNTLWDGTLIEDGSENLRLRPQIASIIATLDGRGILQSIASKNHKEDAMVALSKFGLADFFLYPQVSWGPKGQAVAEIARLLNIGLDTVLFVDDSSFEIQEVRASCPEVRVFDAANYMTIPDLAECKVPVTAESSNRRAMYQAEEVRQSLAKTFEHDYTGFLRSCNIRLTIVPLAEDHLDRAYELSQRTNQMNFSGNRYDKASLMTILNSSTLEAYVASCEDRFGSYGIVGLGVVDSAEPRLLDLMFSCRIQSKRVEHAFLAFLIRKYVGLTGRDFYANYRKTARNAASGQVFTDLGMQESEVVAGVSTLIFRKINRLPNDGIIQLVTPNTELAGQE